MTQNLDALAGQDLGASIRKLANGRTTLDVAQFQFVGFAEIRARYGAAWPEKRERVHTIGRHFIAKRIRMDDLMIPGADGFLIVFARHSGKAADEAAQRISRELNEFFIGGPDSDMRVEATFKQMNAQEIGEAMSSKGELPNPVREKVDDAPITGLITADRIRMSFQPMWDSRREAVSQYIVTQIDPRTNSWVPGYHYETGQMTQRSYVDIDERTLRLSEEALRNLFATGQKALVGAPVHLSSLKNSMAFSRLSVMMGGFDGELKRYRVTRVTGIEAGFPRAYLGDIVRQLRIHSPAVALTFNLADPDPITALKFSPSAIGFALPPGMGEFDLKPEYVNRIRALSEAARPQQVPVFVDGIVSPDLVRRLMTLGVDKFATPSIWPMQDQPAGAQRWLTNKLSQAVGGYDNRAA